MTWVLIILVAFTSFPGAPAQIKQYQVETPYPTREACEAAGAELILDVDTPALLFNCVQKPGEET